MRAHLKYLRYVLIHKWHVFWACLALGVPLHQAIIHDWQKFTPVEWFPYVAYFYGNRPSANDIPASLRHTLPRGFTREEVKEAFDRAWLHHQHYGPHHWQHWILRQDDGEMKALPMPNRFAREMVADWIGAGKALGKPDVEAWFLANKHKYVMDEGTFSLVEQLIKEAQRKGIIPSNAP